MAYNEEKTKRIKNLCWELEWLNQGYGEQIDTHKGSFDYDGVIQLLQQAVALVGDTATFERPDNLPKDIPWCPTPWCGADDDVDPHVYDGSMTPEDYEMMHVAMEKDRKSSVADRLEEAKATVAERGTQTQAGTKTRSVGHDR